ncbi:MAG: site-specific DNA-methyltransferase [Ignavibacteriales bacterium]|nr:site-specific DNA-methyltransferase [Ignavibacteriales bacterium]
MFDFQAGVLAERIHATGRSQENTVEIAGNLIPCYSGEFWTSRQRQAASIHEISYRACFKPQLPRFFIELLTKNHDIVYDPFSGRGTTVIEAGLLGRKAISNDVNPLSRILTEPRFLVPDVEVVMQRLSEIHEQKKIPSRTVLSMFFHPETEKEILHLKHYFARRRKARTEDNIDRWLRMVATNRLTGHSKGFFSVYTLPPNQAVKKESQIKINKRLRQKPQYRDIYELILKKTKSLLRNIDHVQAENLKRISQGVRFLSDDSRHTRSIDTGSVQLTVTSPTGGWVAFEVGEVRSGRVKLEEYVVPLALRSGFRCEGIILNVQTFTKTSNIWGISNNLKGTNTNRIALFHKE